MSMLAERKRKQKWSLNPRGKDWAEDGNKFGQKLLEKMGWSHGKGLGAKEDGRTEHIKVAYKNDTQGMGFKDLDNQWTEHESNFSALLASLGGDSKDTEIKLSSLEKKSESSKARVHYRKFTRGKDLSRYSEKDLANIFGKKSLKEAKKVEEKEPKKPEPRSALEDDPNFLNGGLMSDYFKKKIPNFGQNGTEYMSDSKTEQRPAFGLGFNLKYIDQDSPIKTNGFNNDSESETDVRPSFGFGFIQQTNNNEVSESINNKSHKKVKPTFISYVNDSITETEITPKKKKKDKKKRIFEDSPMEVETPSKRKKLEPQEVHDDTPVKKKKDKKKKSHDSGLSNPAFDPLYSPSKLEKHILEPIEESVTESLNDTLGQVAENFEVQVQIVNESTPVKRKDDEESGSKKKKKKKDNIEVLDVSVDDNSSKYSIIYEDIDLTVEMPKKRKKKSKICEESLQEVLEIVPDESNEVLKKEKKHRKPRDRKASIEITEERHTKSKKKKSKLCEEEGIENPIFDISMENDNLAAALANPYELKVKEKRRKKTNKNKENIGLENPVFNGEDGENSQDLANEEYEVKRKDKSNKRKKKEKEEAKGLDNPALNLNDTVEESYDLMLNIATTPLQNEIIRTEPKEVVSLKKIKCVSRRKSVRFSDVTRERIIPSKEEIQNESLDESRDIVEIEGTLNDSANLTYIDKFIQKKKAKKKNKGLVNGAFDQQANSLEENISSITKTLDTYQAEIENDINEAKLKSVEIDDIMVGEVGNPDGTNEKLDDGTIKLKFKYANFKKTARYIENLTGSKKSYKHLIKGDVIMKFRDTNLHEVHGYAVKNVG